jgi:hypothetical protein
MLTPSEFAPRPGPMILLAVVAATLVSVAVFGLCEAYDTDCKIAWPWRAQTTLARLP